MFKHNDPHVAMAALLKGDSKAFHTCSWAPHEEGCKKPLASLGQGASKEKQNSLLSSDLGNCAAGGEKMANS